MPWFSVIRETILCVGGTQVSAEQEKTGIGDFLPENFVLTCKDADKEKLIGLIKHMLGAESYSKD